MITVLCSSVSETWDKYSLAKIFHDVHRKKAIISLLKLWEQGCKIKEKILSKLIFFFIILLWQTRNNLHEIRSSIEPSPTKSNLTLNNRGMRFNLRIFGPIDIDAVRIRSFEKHRNEEMSYRIIKTISLLNSQVITANNVNVKKLPSAFCVQSIKSYN